MNRIQKSSWNPLFTHARPSNIAVFAWLAFLVALFGGWLEGESTFAFCLGLSVGLSFMQIGFNWGQYQSLWFRFFMQNRDTIFKHAALKVQVQQFSKGNCLCQELTNTSNLRKEL